MFCQISRTQLRGGDGTFPPVRVNEELTLDFDNADAFDVHHYAFHVSAPRFGRPIVFTRVLRSSSIGRAPGDR